LSSATRTVVIGHKITRNGHVVNYVPTRYPSSLSDSIPASRVYTRDAAQEAVRLAGGIVASVREWFAGAS
jgi:HEPN domain-containing protein